MTPKPDPPVLERHRRMAAEWWYGSTNWPTSVEVWITTGQIDDLHIYRVDLPSAAQFAATLERDAYARGYEAGLLAVVQVVNDDPDFNVGDVARVRARADELAALLPETSRGEECTCGEPEDPC